MHTQRSYRCTYWPRDAAGRPIESESGVLPSVRVKADDAEGAARAASYLTGCAVSQVERIEDDEEVAA